MNTAERDRAVIDIRSTLDKFKGMWNTLSNRNRIASELQNLLSGNYPEPAALSFRVEQVYDEVKIVPQNLYTLLRLSGEDVSPIDVEGINEYHTEAGTYAFLNGIPSFSPRMSEACILIEYNINTPVSILNPVTSHVE